jgi:hypothetical protein
VGVARDRNSTRVAERELDAWYKLRGELREVDQRLRAMLDVYEEKPSRIDCGILASTNRATDIGAVVYDIYWIMKGRVHAEDSPLRIDGDVWEAFKEQEDEFLGFYKSALKALETYTQVLRAYNLVIGKAKLRPQLGDLERIRQDEHTHVEERDQCIEAISDFHGKFSTMLTIMQVDEFR